MKLEGLRPSLTPIFEGPFKVIQNDGKNFKILYNNKEKIVNIDKLKPAFLLRQFHDNYPLQKEKKVTFVIN